MSKFNVVFDCGYGVMITLQMEIPIKHHTPHNIDMAAEALALRNGWTFLYKEEIE